MKQMYKDKKGRIWILVATTHNYLWAWFRPIENGDDGLYDRQHRITDMMAV